MFYNKIRQEEKESMAYYKRLLVEAGGAINYANRAVCAEGATLIIGLGGTGTDAAIQIKKEVYRYLESDDEEAIIPKRLIKKPKN